MWKFLAPPAYKPEQTGTEADARYKRLRWQVFIGIFIGYAGFYIVRKNFSMAMPELGNFGYETGELSIVLSMNAIAYALSKFLMGSVSDRSNARVFLPLGLVLAAISMAFMIVPVVALGPDQKPLAIAIMAILNFLVGWFNGMGWPPCGRVMTHWFSVKERGTKMSIWNCAHNVGGALVGRWLSMAQYGSDTGSTVPTRSITSLSVHTLSPPQWQFSSQSLPTVLSVTPRSHAVCPRSRSGVTIILKTTARSRRLCSPQRKFSSNMCLTTNCCGISP